MSPSRLDYWSRALDFVKAVRSAHPARALTFTGHSLGAALALMMAAVGGGPEQGVQSYLERQTRAIAFSSPAWVQPLRRRWQGALPAAAAARNSLAALADQFDPVQEAPPELNKLS